jgi:peptidoglycan-N-acetylglucosamine deacetylase
MISDKMILLTFDTEDWFHINFDKDFNNEDNWNKFPSRIEASTDLILEILGQKKIQATFFCLGWVARKYPELIKRISSQGHEIGSHSDIHNLSSGLTEKEFEDDLKKSISSLENVIGSKITLFRAPGFSIGRSNLWAFDKLAENGIEIDCSIFPAKHQFGGFPEIKCGNPFILKHNNISIKEIPISTFNFLGKPIVLTGGGYFRLTPYFLIKQFIKNNDYIITYFHPRDFDKNQPVLENINILRRFKSYYGLNHSFKKFTKLISEFELISISAANNRIDWEKCNTVHL